MSLFSTDTTRAMVQTIGSNAKGTYVPEEGGAGTEIDVAFRNESETAQMFEISVENSDSAAFVVTADLTGTVEGGRLLIGSVNYYIIGPGRPDAEGMTLLILSEVPADE